MIELQLPLTNVNNGNTSLDERFWAKVMPVTESGCWLWVGSTDSAGYGLIKAFNRLEKAHRASYTLTHGEIPAHVCVLHRCDIPSCVNPHHLFLGTHEDNARDRDRKNRFVSHNQKLSDHDVLVIREEAKAGDRWAPGNLKALAARYGVSYATISGIKNGHSRGTVQPNES